MVAELEESEINPPPQGGVTEEETTMDRNKTYLLNAFSAGMLPENGGVIEFTPLTGGEEEARLMLVDGFVSAVGHASTAEVFAARLGLPVETRRVDVKLQPGDWAVVGQLGTRLAKGKILSAEKLGAPPLTWMLVHVRGGGIKEGVYPYHCRTCWNSFGEFCKHK